jgi:hypothetical protein
MRSRERRSEQRAGWIFGLVLIVVGSVFLLQNWGLPVLIGNWWALFILIPAIGAFTAAWTVYRQDGQFTPRVSGTTTSADRRAEVG